MLLEEIIDMDTEKKSEGEKINSPEFWDLAYSKAKPRFDHGQVLPAVKRYFSQPDIDKSVNILIPGAGNAYEAEFLHQQGYKNVYVVDFAPTPIANFRHRVASFPYERVMKVDFFELADITPDFKHKFDYIIEKAFFCAITPDLRKKYVNTMYHLLKHKGVLFGIFVIEESASDQESYLYPPYTCTFEDYKALFMSQFNIKVLGKKDANCLIKIQKF
ncbi:methyltransferase [Psychrobacter sp. HD31]|uniref:methyltransferase n=1 Tax=Psychrobacter sp. HD31 TaxID=3112003 RepID=UPI003DA5961C